MLRPEKNYDFRKELMQVHKKDRRNKELLPKKKELVLSDGICIVLPEEESIVISTAAQDFVDYLRVSMNEAAMISDRAVAGCTLITLSLNQDIEEASGYMGYRTTVESHGILIEGYDHKGVAQALYGLEDIMNMRKAPFIELGVIKRKAVFNRRFTQSPLGYMEYPDEILATIAHYGMDCIVVWMRDVERNLRGDYVDLALLCDRAEKYGIDVYLESYIIHSKHPDEPDAQEYYDNLYGNMFKRCPKLKGVSLNGEASQFYSRDPRALTPEERNTKDNIPKTKPNPGWWPCNDYPQWIAVIQKAIYQYRPDADIVFSTYNWSGVDEEARLNLIRNLPKDISLMPAWNIFSPVKFEDVTDTIMDFTLGCVEVGESFKSEAIEAKKQGIRLYAEAQLSGRTWDFGVIPYEPVPYRWMEFYANMLEAKKEWNVCGIVENIHFGFCPSFITDLEKQAFFTGGKPVKEVLWDLLMRDFGAENIEAVDKAMQVWSEAITHYIATNEDQYGAFRIGPSYPLWTQLGWGGGNYEDGKYPASGRAYNGNGIYFNRYIPYYKRAYTSLPGMRLYNHIKEFSVMRDLLLEGIRILETIENPDDKLRRLINIGWFMYRTTITVLNVKQLFIHMRKLDIEPSREESKKLLDGIEKILRNEKENVEATIPLVQLDSRLGWEPSMEYTTDEAALRWKLRQLDVELNDRLPLYRKKADS